MMNVCVGLGYCSTVQTKAEQVCEAVEGEAESMTFLLIGKEIGGDLTSHQ